MTLFKSNKVAPISSTISVSKTPPPPPPPSPVLSGLAGPSRASMDDESPFAYGFGYDSAIDEIECMCCKCSGDHCVANTAIICVSAMLLVVLL